MRTTKRLAVATMAVLVVFALTGCGSADRLTRRPVEKVQYASTAVRAVESAGANGADGRMAPMSSGPEVIAVVDTVLRAALLVGLAARPML